MYIWKWFTTHIRDTGCYFIIALNKSLFYFITICRFWGRNIIAKRLFVHTLCMYIYIAPTRLMIGPTVLPPYTIQHCCSRNMRTTPERHFFLFIIITITILLLIIIIIFCTCPHWFSIYSIRYTTGLIQAYILYYIHLYTLYTKVKENILQHFDRCCNSWATTRLLRILQCIMSIYI